MVADGGIGIDATVPLDQKDQFQRARYPVADMDFSRWFSEGDMAELRSIQERYFKFFFGKDRLRVSRPKQKTGYA